MLFNSIEFALFFPVVFSFYWLAAKKSLWMQNAFLLLASYIFYAWWDWRFLLLLILLTLANYLIAIGISNIEKAGQRRLLFLIAITINVGTLIVFKYFNFFIGSLIEMMHSLGYNLPTFSTGLILPLGISFYIFLSLSYIIDVYRRSLEASRNMLETLLTLSFFPIILAGPIQRPASLLPQIATIRNFRYEMAVDGLKQILWGLFIKVVIADNLGLYVDKFFNESNAYSGSTLLLGAFFYAIQIYADFSGYSEIAIGIAKLLGIKLMRNFAYPYLSQDITEFWKRWHISLTTWFRDYIFMPLSFKISWRLKSERVLSIKSDIFIYLIASMVTWLLTGLWHGANYTFIVWGLLHGMLLILYRIQFKARKRLYSRTGLRDNKIFIFIETIITFVLVMFIWVFFRSEDIGHALFYFSQMFSSSLFTIPSFNGIGMATVILILVIFMLIAEWRGRDDEYALKNLGKTMPSVIRYFLYLAMTASLFIFHGQEQQFIYFQF